VCGVSELIAADTATFRIADPAPAAGVWLPYARLVPYWKA
jgi:hypothetical protein